jgi:hypothetical protein
MVGCRNVALRLITAAARSALFAGLEMARDKILLENYVPELSVLYSFYKYSDRALTHPGVLQKLISTELEGLSRTVSESDLGRLFDSDVENQVFQASLGALVPDKVTIEVTKGLAILRRQLLEAAYSVFENFLSHVLRVYLYKFPQLLKGIERSVDYRDLVELIDHDRVLEHMVEDEVRRFSFKSLGEKKEYINKRLQTPGLDSLWVEEGAELWKDIDAKRKAIVHGEELPEISEEYLLRAINYFQRFMLGFSVHAQAEQGVPFSWGFLASHVKTRVPPKL